MSLRWHQFLMKSQNIAMTIEGTNHCRNFIDLWLIFHFSDSWRGGSGFHRNFISSLTGCPEVMIPSECNSPNFQRLY